MNRIYRLVFNRETRQVQVASELARSPSRQGVSSGRGGHGRMLAGTALACALVAPSLSAQVYTADTVIDTPVDWIDENVRIGGPGEVEVRVEGNGWLRASVTPGTPQLYWDGRIEVGGSFTGGEARLIVSGPDAGLYAFNSLDVGIAGSQGQGTRGVLRIEGGAQASTITPGRRRGLFQVGLNGEATVTGAGSTLETGEFAMGVVLQRGGGRMQVLDGGLFLSDRASLWGNAPGERLPTVRVAGSEARWENAGHLDLGGVVEVAAGGGVTTGSVEIRSSFDTPHLVGIRADGVGSRFESAATIEVRDASVTVSDGATVAAAEGIVLVGNTAPARPLASFLNIGGGVAEVGSNDVPTPAAAAAAGLLDPATVVRFQANDGGRAQINFNHTGTDHVFGNDIVGTGVLNSFSGTTILTGDLRAFSPIDGNASGRFGVRVAGGSTLVLRGDINTTDANDGAFGPDTSTFVVEDGTLVVGGETGRLFDYLGAGGRAYSSVVEVMRGALAGNGTVGTTAIGADGTISPGGDGTAIGTLTVIGRLLLADGSTYAVDIAGDGGSDRIRVVADAPLGSTLPGQPGAALIGEGVDVRVTTLDAATGYQDGQQYTILETDAPIEGRFAEALTTSAFLDVALEHLEREVRLRIALKDDGPADLVIGDGVVHTGTAAVGGLQVLDGGTLAIGGAGALGALSATGDLLFATGSTWAVDIAGDGGSDRLQVAGKATLQGGTVEVTALDPAAGYQQGQRYTILEAAGGVDGTFAGALSKSAFLTTTLDYATAGQVGLSIGLVGDDDGDIVVEAGQTYTGTGAIGALDVRSGGVLAPGGRAALGQLSAGGDLDFASGAIWAVDIAGDGGGDRLQVAGTATLAGGTVEVTALDAAARYQDGQHYTILEAGGGVDGQFDAVVSKSAFLDAALDYATAGQVGLRIGLLDDGGPVDPVDPVDPVAPPQVFQRVAETANQYNTAVALNALPQQGEALALYNTLLMLDADSARSAFGQLSGEAYAGVRGQLLGDRFLRGGIDQRLAGRGPGQQDAGTRFWLGGGGLSQRTDGDGNASQVRTQRQGLQAGLEWNLDAWTLGVAAGHEAQRVRTPALASQARVDGTHLGLYAATAWQALSLAGGIGYADYHVDMRRDGAIGPRWAQSTHARQDASATSAFVRAGMDVVLGRTVLTPTLTLAWQQLDSDAVIEAGDATALRIAERSDELATASLGLRLQRALSVGAIDNASLFGGIAWQRADGDLDPTGRHAFVADGEAFTAHGAPLARNSALVDVGVAVNTSPDARLSIAAQGQRGGGTSAFGAQLNWAWRF